MAESTRPFAKGHLTQIEPDERLVVLARTMQAQGPGSEKTWKDGAINWTRFITAEMYPQIVMLRAIWAPTSRSRSSPP